MILVDPPNAAGHGRLWSHVASDTSFAELHAFARGLGLPQRGFDRDHYDVPAEWHDRVVAAGAHPVSSRELVARLVAAGLRRRKRAAAGVPAPAAIVPPVSAPHPTYDQLVAMPAWAEQPVPIAFEDANGHLNVRHYTGIASEGLDESLVELGIPQNWPAQGHACFSAEHHLTYLAELRTGDHLSARVRLLGRSERAAHALVYLLDDTHQRVSYVMEEVFLHIDLETRRTAPWPEDVAAGLDRRIAEDAELPWAPDVSGCLSLR